MAKGMPRLGALMNNSLFSRRKQRNGWAVFQAESDAGKSRYFAGEQVEGGVRHVLVETFNNARSYDCCGRINMERDKLHFFDETGKEVVVSSMPFVAKEIASEEAE